MNKIGIIQGRVLPDQLEKLQVFPEKWGKELSVIKKIGFDYLELLDDKKGKLREILKNNKEELLSLIENNGLRCSSVCADRLCAYSLLEDESTFFSQTDSLLNLFSGRRGLVFVVPFFDENKINSKEDLENVFQILSKHNFGRKILALEIDLPAGDLKEKLDKYNLKNVGICFDTGNRIGCGVDLEKEIKMLSNYINHVHIKYKENGKNVRIKGDSNQLERGFKALKDIDYKGLIVLETSIASIPEEEARKNLTTVQKYLSQ